MVLKLIFKEILEKRDSFQIMYEVFKDDNKKIIETGGNSFCQLKIEWAR